jgi:Uma2 family endonuclease
MTAVPKPRLTPEQYLAIERTAEFKSEFYDGEMFAMAGASFRHNVVRENLAARINAALQGGPCRSVSSDQRVKVTRTGLYTYPDIVIVCGEPQFDDADVDTLLNPQVIIEVLSESTANYCRTKKYRHYQQIESLREYILVEQDEPVFEQYVRQPNGSWARTDVVGLDREFAFATVPVRVRLSDVYAGVTFPEAGGAA